MKNKKPLVIFLIVVFIAGAFLLYKFLPRGQEKSVKQLLGEKNEISAIIIPHHDLIKDKREELLSQLKNKTTAKTIILLSTNHFQTGSKNIITTEKQWQLSNGTLLPNKDIINNLTADNLVENNENAFSEEHGIKNVLPDIAINFPGRSIVPLIIKNPTDEQEIDRLNQLLNKSCSGNCLLISSIDFSHYLPGSLAELHDDLSVRTLNNLDEALVKRTESDSPEVLLLTIKWAKMQEKIAFNLFFNSNSGKLNNERDSESTSYVLGWYEEGPIEKINNEFTFMVGGDMMFDRNIEYTFPGDKMVNVMKNFGNRVFLGTDLSLTNLEGPISPTPRIPEKNHSMVFNFQPNIPEVLNWLGINAVSLANNHTLNNGAAGLANTKKVLPESGITYVGQDEEFTNDSVKSFSAGNTTLTVIAVDILNTNDDLVSTIKKKKEMGNYVLIYPHWGTEYEPIHSKQQENLAHSWINAGADFVFGSHPHVVQDAEIYKGKPIFYSLGNLLFDQDFSAETQRGLIVGVKIKEGKISLVLVPTISRNYMPQLLSGDEKTRFLTKFRNFLGSKIIEQNYGYDKIELS